MIILPIFNNYHFSYDMQLEKRTYWFAFKYNRAAKTFLMSMRDSDRTLFKDIALVTGIDLLKTSAAGELGVMFLADMQDFNQHDPEDIGQFVSRFKLAYFTKAEDAAL